MSMHRQAGCSKLNLAVSVLALKVLIASSACEAAAESLSNEDFSFEHLPPSELQVINSTNDSTLSPIILSQVPNPSQAPNPITPPPVEPVPVPSPLPETPLETTPSTPPQSEPRPDIPGTITVKQFEFEGNTVFSDQKLREEIAKVIKTDQPITFAELLQVESVITELYTKEGYVNSGAVIPADQAFSPQGAVVKVNIVEGEIEEIRVTGTRRLNQNYIRSRIKLGTDKPLNRFRLLEALQLLQLNPLIENISAELSAGSSPEQSVLEVRVNEADSFRTELFIDNGRAPSVGSFRRGIRITEGNVFGLGDSFGATYTNTDGSNSLDLSYSVPLNARNGSINVSGGFTDTSVIEPPFDRVDITGDSYYINLGFRQPVIQSPTSEFALGFTLSRSQSNTQLFEQGFALSPGADEEGETRISALRFFQEYTQRSSQQVFAVRSQFSVGVGWLDATVNNNAPDSRFFAWRGQGQYVRLLARDTLFLFRSDVQLSTRALVPLEQIGVGGLQSVRGYRQDELLVDNGLFASAEVRLPILRVDSIDGLLQIVPFVDFGVGWNSSGRPNRSPNTLVGVGVGLQWQMGDNLNARLDYGIPLTDVESRDDDRTLQERGFYFSVNYSPF